VSRDRLYAQGAAVALLLLLAALAVAFSLLEAQWGPGLGMLPWLVAGSVLLTLLLVRSAAPPWLLHLLSLAVGLALTIYLAGRFALPGLEAGDATRLLSHRLALWASAIRQGVPADDLLPFSVLLGLCLWLTFHYSAWLIYRSGRVWWAVVGPAIALLVNTYYAPHINTVYVGFYAFCALLLVMRVSLQGLTQDWRLARIPHDRTLGEDFLVDAACMVAVVLTLSWVLPPLTLEQGALRAPLAWLPEALDRAIPDGRHGSPGATDIRARGIPRTRRASQSGGYPPLSGADERTFSPAGDGL